jgi:Secretion system C-terminal sorting domain
MKHIYLSRLAIIAGIVLVAFTSKAQIVDCNAFLQGRYLEVGISPMGAFGSSVGQPAGYHGNVDTGSVSYHPCGTDTALHGLGFVADIDTDGWAVGTPPYYGDYFLPGSPYEGWSVQIGGVRADAFNTNPSFTGSLTGTNVSYSDSMGILSSVWSGTYDCVVITRTTTLDTNGLYFSVSMNFRNTASVPKNDIYFLETVDPDNDEPLAGGSFVTNNTVVYNRPSDSFSLVTAVGTVYSVAYLGLGSADSNSRVFIYSAWPLAAGVGLDSIYNEHYGATFSCTSFGDVAIGIVFNIPHLAPLDSASDSVAYRTTSSTALHPANSKTITYFYAFNPTSSTTALHGATPGTLAITDINNTIAVYPNPAHNNLNVKGLNTTDNLQLFDMTGKIVIQQNAGNGTATINISNLPVGAYVLNITDASGIVKGRFPVQKN